MLGLVSEVVRCVGSDDGGATVTAQQELKR